MDAFVVVSHSTGLLSVEQSGTFQTLNYYKSKATRSPICIPFCHIKDASLKASRYSKMCFASKGSFKIFFVSMVNTPLVVCHFLPILWSKKTTPMSLSLSAATVRGCHTYLQHWRVKWAFVGTQPLLFPCAWSPRAPGEESFPGKSLLSVTAQAMFLWTRTKQSLSDAGAVPEAGGSANSSHKASLRCSETEQTPLLYNWTVAPNPSQ